jgi:uncharacterized protein (DUF2141 family)
MRRFVLFLISAVFLILFNVPPVVHAASRNEIRVVVKGLRDDKGRVGCGLFKGPDGFPSDESKEFAGAWVPIHNRVAVCFFKGAPAGIYAATVLDDDNMDGKMDFGPLGIPKKGYGFSNNARAILSAPSFDAASFKYSGEGTLSVSINVVYFRL